MAHAGSYVAAILDELLLLDPEEGEENVLVGWVAYYPGNRLLAHIFHVWNDNWIDQRKGPNPDAPWYWHFSYHNGDVRPTFPSMDGRNKYSFTADCDRYIGTELGPLPDDTRIREVFSKAIEACYSAEKAEGRSE